MKPALALTMLIALLSGCSDSVSCLLGATPAIAVNVTVVGEATHVLGARGEIIDGSFRDSLVETGEGWYQAGVERGGTYAVHLEHPGYSVWDTAEVFVSETGGDCSTVVTQEIHARLSAIP